MQLLSEKRFRLRSGKASSTMRMVPSSYGGGMAIAAPAFDELNSLAAST